VIRLRTPGTVTTDRGYGEANVDRELTDLGVKKRGDPPLRQTLPGPASRRTPASLPTNNQVAHRKRRPHQYPQAWLRLGSHPHRRHRRRPNLDRARRPDPQPGQDQCPRRVIDTAQATLMRQTGHDPTQPLSTGQFFRSK